MADEEIRSMREILRDMEKTLVETCTIVKSQKEKTEDHETRIRSLEKSKNKIVAGVTVASGTGITAWLKSLFGY